MALFGLGGLGSTVAGFFGSAAVKALSGDDDDDGRQQGFVSNITDKYSKATGALIAAKTSKEAGTEVAQYGGGTPKETPQSKAMKTMSSLRNRVVKDKKNAMALVSKTAIPLIKVEQVEEEITDKSKKEEVIAYKTPNDQAPIEFDPDV